MDPTRAYANLPNKSIGSKIRIKLLADRLNIDFQTQYLCTKSKTSPITKTGTCIMEDSSTNKTKRTSINKLSFSLKATEMGRIDTMESKLDRRFQTKLFCTATGITAHNFDFTWMPQPKVCNPFCKIWDSLWHILPVTRYYYGCNQENLFMEPYKMIT